jgi:hypothetical protein
MTMFASATQPPALDWATDNQAYLNQELRRLRLLLQRRVLWLRRQWRHDPLQTYQAQVISEEQADWLLAGEDTQAEMRFYCEDGAAAISRSIAELERALNGQRQHLIDAGTPAALEVLVRLFGLTAFERNVLLLCLAPDLDPAFERLYAYVQDEVSRRYATPQLALSLFVSGETNEARSARCRQPHWVLDRCAWTSASPTICAASTGSTNGSATYCCRAHPPCWRPAITTWWSNFTCGPPQMAVVAAGRRST